MSQNIDVKTEEYNLVDHDPNWAQSFVDEEQFLRSVLPSEVIGVITHIGSTAILGIKAKPIIDILMEVTSQREAREIIAQILESHGYQHIIHPALSADEPPESSWFIKRDEQGNRTHHVWCAESNTPVWGRLLFVQYLNEHPEIAREYEGLKLQLLADYPGDRRQYLVGKSDFVNRITQLAREQYT